MNIWRLYTWTHWYFWHDWLSQLYKQLNKKKFRPRFKPIFLGFSERSHQLLKMVEGFKELKFNISISNRLPFFEQLSNIDPNKGTVLFWPSSGSVCLPRCVKKLLLVFASLKGLRRLWLWTVTIFSFALFLRGEEPLCLKLRHLNCLKTMQESFSQLLK